MEETRQGRGRQEDGRTGGEEPALLGSVWRLRRLALLLRSSGLHVLEYLAKDDVLLLYDGDLEVERRIPRYLKELEQNSELHPEDRGLMKRFLTGELKGPLELRFLEEGRLTRKILDGSRMFSDEFRQDTVIGSIKDVTMEKQREEILRDRAMRDSLTGLYNRISGKVLVNEYLASRDPFTSSGMVVLDVDYFKQVNDTYGHLFGDRALTALAAHLTDLFGKDNIIARAGGDEFVVFLKKVSNPTLVQKVLHLIASVRELPFEEEGYCMTCSAGVCFLPENVSGYTYDQLFENADWALYRAKELGRNRSFFCDSLERFEREEGQGIPAPEGIDARYLHNDIIATAFEIFDKTGSFHAAVELLLKVIGIRFRLDRITIVQTDVKTKATEEQFLWTSKRAPAPPRIPGSFTEEDFLALFHSYDEYGTAVLQWDSMEGFSESAVSYLMQGGAKTVVNCATYCQGRYTGAIAYVACGEKRRWSIRDRKQFGELTKIISMHMERDQAVNGGVQGHSDSPDYDSLTGLLAFSRFREQVERFIVGGYGVDHVLVYSDINGFSRINQAYGYSEGDRFLKFFCDYVIGTMKNKREVLFARVVADQFVLFMPYKEVERAESAVRQINEAFSAQCREKYPEAPVSVSSGIYFVSPGCAGASEAIDAANQARRQAKGIPGSQAVLYREGGE